MTTRSCIPFLLLLAAIFAGILYTDHRASDLEQETLVVAVPVAAATDTLQLVTYHEIQP